MATAATATNLRSSNGDVSGLQGDDHRRTALRMESIAEYPMDHVVEKYAKEYDVPLELAKEHEFELKRYFQLAALNPKFDYGMAGPIDDLWHTFILFTKDYGLFCDNMIGRFLHHYPDRMYDGEPKGENVETSDTLEWYAKFLKDYALLFGQQAPAHIWPNVMEFEATGSLCRVCGTDPKDDGPEPI